MNRRRFLLTALAGALAAPPSARAGIPRIGVLCAVSPELAPHTNALREGLRDLGYIEGKNIVSEWRWAGANVTRFPELAAELVRLNVDVIVADNNPAIAATQKATKLIPIVMAVATDPVGLGFVSSLARPGGNITGLAYGGLNLVGKRLEMLKAIVPTLTSVSYLWDPSEPGRREHIKEVEEAAQVTGIAVHPTPVQRPNDLDAAFAAVAKDRAKAVLVGGSSMLYAQRTRIGDLSTRFRLATSCGATGYVTAGCLFGYSARFSDMFRRAAYFVDRILRGAKPADLPVEQPTTFELVINLKTAKALGLTIPSSLLARADQVIQ